MLSALTGLDVSHLASLADVLDDDENTPLELALEEGHKHVADYLKSL